MKASVDMSTALKKRDVNRASELAEEAQSHFQHVVERLDAIPVPEDEDLQTFLRQTIQGYKLMPTRTKTLPGGRKLSISPA